MVRVAVPEPLPTRSQMRHTRAPFLFYTLDIRNDHRHLRTTWSQSIAISCLLFAISRMMMPVVRLKWHFIASNNILQASANTSDNLTLFYLKHGNAFHGRNTLYLWQLVSHKTFCMQCILWITICDHELVIAKRLQRSWTTSVAEDFSKFNP